MTPFAVTSTHQFRAPKPYGASSNALAVLTAEYTADFNEVKSLGCTDCAARTQDQTEIARFWLENSPTAWNRVAVEVAGIKALDACRTRVTKTHHRLSCRISEFDSYATNLESKYFYNFWRR